LRKGGEKGVGRERIKEVKTVRALLSGLWVVNVGRGTKLRGEREEGE